MEDFNFFVCLYENQPAQTIDDTIRDLSRLSGTDFSVVNRYDSISCFSAKTTPDTFQRLFGVKPEYSPEEGWSFDSSKLMYSLKSIELVHPNSRLSLT